MKIKDSHVCRVQLIEINSELGVSWLKYKIFTTLKNVHLVQKYFNHKKNYVIKFFNYMYNISTRVMELIKNVKIINREQRIFDIKVLLWSKIDSYFFYVSKVNSYHAKFQVFMPSASAINWATISDFDRPPLQNSNMVGNNWETWGGRGGDVIQSRQQFKIMWLL